MVAHPWVMPVAARALMASSWVEPSSSPKASGPAGRSARVRKLAIWPREPQLGAETGPGFVASQGDSGGREPGDLLAKMVSPGPRWARR